MKFTIAFVSTLSLTALATAVPTKRDAPTDTDILNFALSLEHLENEFYRQGLEKYSEKEFEDAGFESWIRPRFEQIAEHEKTHVSFLSGALGGDAVKKCDYNFPHTDPASFVDLSNILENVGASAYTGAAKYIHNSAYLTAAASILTVEARHAAWVNSAVRKGSAWGTAFDIPLDLNQVWSIASGLITSCPSTNPTLPVRAFPPLTAHLASPTSKTITLSFTGNHDNHPLYAAFLTGSGVLSSPLTKHGNKWEAHVPDGLLGFVYLLVTDSQMSVADENTIAGPAILEFKYDAEGRRF